MGISRLSMKWLGLLLICTMAGPVSRAQWVKSSVNTYGYSTGSIAVLDSTVLVPVVASGFLRSTDQGTTWTSSSALASIFMILVVYDGAFLAGTSGQGIYRSTDLGVTWDASNTGLSNWNVTALAVCGRNIFAGTDSGLFVTSNGGSMWSRINSPLDTLRISAIAGSSDSIVVGTDSGAFRLFNDGVSWTTVPTPLPKVNINALLIQGSTTFAGVADSRVNREGVYVSTDNGTSWSNGGPDSLFVFTLAGTGQAIFAGGAAGVYLSTNNGKSWKAVSEGLLPQAYVWSLALVGSNILAATNGLGIFHRPLSELVTSVTGESGHQPVAFSLEQNYPNPFNPSTTIRYELPISSRVRLGMYDILGREVSVLVNEWKSAGEYEVKFDGSDLSSGVYFYRLQAGGFVQARKLLLTR